jgi:low affinity Fe/Cu permease
MSDKSFNAIFTRLAGKVTKATGSPFVVMTAFGVVIVWAICGPIFHYSEQWQLVINTGTTIITFMMVFIIQHSQNKDTAAIQIKLNELIAANEHASNRVVNSEDLTDQEQEVLKKFYKKISDLAGEDKELFTSHSVDEASDNHLNKVQH